MGKSSQVLMLILVVGLGGAAISFLLLGKGTGNKNDVPTDPGAALPAEQSALFEDRTPNSGIAFTYRNGEEADHYTILETLGGGVALFDYDQDGWLDIFVTGDRKSVV